MKSIKSQWQIIEDSLRINNPDILEDLNPPASDYEINELEKKINNKLPSDFIEFLKIHNGQKGLSNGLFNDLEFLSTDRIFEEWTIWKELKDNNELSENEADTEKGVQNVWWSPQWIPFTYNGAGDNMCLDLAPGIGGHLGQVIAMWHDDSKRIIEANSFTAWLSSFINTL